MFHDKDDLSACEVRLGDHGAIQIAKPTLGGTPAQRESDLDVKLVLGDGFDRERLAEFFEIIEGGDGEIDFFGAQSERRFALVAMVGLEGLDLGSQNVDRGRMRLEIEEGGGFRLRLGEFGKLLIESEEIPDSEGDQEGKGGQCNDHDDTARAWAVATSGWFFGR